MPDTTLCRNVSCPLNVTCYRYNATPSEFWQSYASFESVWNPEKEEWQCDYYIDIEEVE